MIFRLDFDFDQRVVWEQNLNQLRENIFSTEFLDFFFTSENLRVMRMSLNGAQILKNRKLSAGSLDTRWKYF